jgi:hypothetical protein
MEGDDWPSVIVETALPMTAAQIWPSRPEPAAKFAEQDNQPDVFCTSLVTAGGWEDTFRV